MTNKFCSTPSMLPWLGGYGTTGILTSLALDSDFVLGAAGDCLGVRFLAPPGGVHIDYVYVFLSAADAEGQDLICHTANYGASATQAGSSISSVTQAGGTTAATWVKFTFTDTTALTANELYWVVVGDAAGSGDGYQVRSRATATAFSNTIANTFFAGYTNDAGFSTAGTTITHPVPCIIVFSDGTVIGNPYTAYTADTSNQLERGLVVSGLSANTKICGVSFTPSTNMTTLQIYEGNTAPAGTVWSGFNGGSALTLTTNQKAIGGAFFTPVELSRDTIYRITFKFSGNSTVPGYQEVEDYATPSTHALACCLGQGQIYRTIDNGSGGWTDVLYHLTRMAIIIEDQVTIGGSSWAH